MLVVLIISIVGLLIVIPYVLLAMLSYFFATTAVAAFVAQRVLAGSKQNDNLMLAVTLGIVGTTIVSRIPVLGPLLNVVMVVFGTGAIALAIVEWRQARRLAAAPARRERRSWRRPATRSGRRPPRRSLRPSPLRAAAPAELAAAAAPRRAQRPRRRRRSPRTGCDEPPARRPDAAADAAPASKSRRREVSGA